MQDQMNQSRHTIIDSAIALAGLTAYLYAVSTSYYGGYFNHLELDPNVLDLNFNQTLYNGFLLCSVPVFLFLAVIALVSWVYSHNVLPTTNDWLRKSRINKRKYIKARRWFVGSRRDSLLEQREKRRTLSAITYVIGVVLVIFSLAYFESMGGKVAASIKQSLSDGSYLTRSHWYVKIDDTNRKLLPLACGARNCAGVDTTSRFVYYFPQNGHAYEPQVTVTTTSTSNKSTSTK